jgi:hypothetical protein
MLGAITLSVKAVSITTIGIKVILLRVVKWNIIVLLFCNAVCFGWVLILSVLMLLYYAECY